MIGSRIRTSTWIGLASLLLWGAHLGYVVGHHLKGDTRGLLLLGTRHRHPEPMRGAPRVEGHGHDGQFYAALATDPFFGRPETAAAMDSPVYRGTRVGFPLIAWVLALGHGRAAVTIYQLLTWLGAALLPWLLSRWLEDEGACAVWAAPAALMAGVLSSVYASLPDVAVMTISAAAVWRYGRGGRGTVALLVLAALVKETSLFVAAPLALMALRERRYRVAAEIAVLPLATVAAWRLWITWRVGGGPAGDGRENFGLPMRWVAAKLSQTLDVSEWSALVALALALVAALLLTRDFRRWRAPEACFFVAALVAAFLTEHVYLPTWFNHSRVLMPVATFAVVVGERRSSTVERWVYRLVPVAWSVPTILLLPAWAGAYAAAVAAIWLLTRHSRKAEGAAGGVARAAVDTRLAP